MSATQYVPPVGRHLRTNDAAAFLGIAPQTLRNWKALRIGPPARKLSGRLVVYSLDDLHAFMRHGRRRPQSTTPRHCRPGRVGRAEGCSPL